MKKIVAVVLVIGIATIISFNGCSETKEPEEWELYQTQIPRIADDAETQAMYYKACLEGDLPQTEDRMQVLNMYKENHPEKFAEMVKPVVIREEGGNNIILFADESGNIYSTESEEAIGKINE